jgi:transcriptional regulator with XRE-family HTH domain|tara:strand:- start:31 stop:408 length:378 start_codon:yes stop_codon:yes gene_type:complete
MGEFMEDNFNIHLGKKLRMRRLSLGLTQTKVAEAINVTFQQIQKYEKGTNGVSSARLMQISHFLKVPVTYFYEEYRDYKSVGSEEVVSENFNYSFLIKTFNSLSKAEKDKILQSLKNTESLDKTG